MRFTQDAGPCLMPTPVHGKIYGHSKVADKGRKVCVGALEPAPAPKQSLAA